MDPMGTILSPNTSKSQVVRAETSPYEKRHSPKVKRSRDVGMMHKKSSNFTDLDVPKYTLPETNSKFAPENGWLEYDSFLLGHGMFSGANCWFQGGYFKQMEMLVWKMYPVW